MENGELRLGFDVGGSHIAGALFAGGQMLEKIDRAYPKEDPDSLPMAVAAMAKRLAGDEGIKNIASLGIVVPGSISKDKNKVLKAYNLGLFDCHLPRLIQNALGAEIKVPMANDADGAAWGEYKCGALKGYDNSVLITIGTGIGGGIILNGSLFTGGMGNGVELGHFIMERKSGEICSCGAKGCFESACSATALIRQGNKAADAAPQSLLAAARVQNGALDAKIIIDCSRAGDKAAEAVFSEYTRALGSAIASIVNILDPQCIAIGGGVSGAGEFLLKPVRAAAYKLGFYDEKANIVAASLGNDAGLYGAALL